MEILTLWNNLFEVRSLVSLNSLSPIRNNNLLFLFVTGKSSNFDNHLFDQTI